MKKCLFALAALSLLFACTPEESDADDSQSGNGGDKIVHVTGISLDITYATIKEGEQLVLVATITPDNAENKTVMWSSSSDAIASVDNSGKVTGIKAGSATITATTEDGGMKASCTLSVEVNLAPVITIGADHVSATSAVLYGKANLGSTVADDLQVGFQYSKSSGILPSNSTTVEGDDADSNYNYSSTITGLEPATTYYFRSFVRQNGQYTYGETKSFTTTVILVESISLDKSSLSLGIGNEATISITSILPDNANDKTVTWSSSNSAVASVDNNGKVTAKAKGNATIKATANDGSGVFASCAVVVDNIAVPQAVDMGTVVEGKNVKWATFNIGASEPEDYGEYYAWGETAPKTNYSWANYKFGASNTLTKYNTNSSNGAVDNRITLEPTKDDVAHVKLGGNWRMPTDAEWTALRTKCTWSWTTRNGVNGMLVRATNGNSIFLPAAGFWEDTGLYNAGTRGDYWSSSLNGNAPYNAWSVYFLSDGNNKYGRNRYRGFSIRPVEAPWVVPQSVSLDKTSIAFDTIGNTLTLKATVLPADATDKSLSWTSDKEAVATVDANGRVTAKGNGKATITVTTKDQGKTASCEVTVTQRVTSITLDKSYLRLVIGHQATLSVTSVQPDNANDKTYTWSSSENSIASVDNNGKVTAKAKGNTTIKATANDGSGVFASCSIVVREPYTAVSGEAVDLGLSVKWSSTNLGATSPSDYGDYFAWGETAPKDNYSLANYELCNGSLSTLTKYNNSSSYGAVDNKSEFKDYGYEDDAARQALGGKWRVPTDAEWTELRTKCTWTWTTNYNGTGVKGRIVTASNGNSIFLPAAGVQDDTGIYGVGFRGRYWSSSLETDRPYSTRCVGFDSDNVYRHSYYRYYGFSVRPVYDGSYDDIYVPGTNEGTEEENWN